MHGRPFPVDLRTSLDLDRVENGVLCLEVAGSSARIPEGLDHDTLAASLDEIHVEDLPGRETPDLVAAVVSEQQELTVAADLGIHRDGDADALAGDPADPDVFRGRRGPCRVARDRRREIVDGGADR